MQLLQQRHKTTGSSSHLRHLEQKTSEWKAMEINNTGRDLQYTDQKHFKCSNKSFPECIWKRKSKPQINFLRDKDGTPKLII